MLYTLVYMSTYIGQDTPTDMETILQSARRRNNADGITGLLIFHDDNFFQVLEGPKQKVLDCYARIENNERHRGCTILEEKEIDTRKFAGWDMGYIPLAELAPDHRQDFIDLQHLKNTEQMDQLHQDRRTGHLVDAFLSGFGDRRVA